MSTHYLQFRVLSDLKYKQLMCNQHQYRMFVVIDCPGNQGHQQLQS